MDLFSEANSFINHVLTEEPASKGKPASQEEEKKMSEDKDPDQIDSSNTSASSS